MEPINKAKLVAELKTSGRFGTFQDASGHSQRGKPHVCEKETNEDGGQDLGRSFRSFGS